jgi:hypothetical protein
MRWAGHVACIWEMNAYKCLVGKLKEADHFGDLDIDGRIILKWIIEKQCLRGVLEIQVAQNRV